MWVLGMLAVRTGPLPVRDTEQPVVRPYWLVDDIKAALDAASEQGAFVAIEEHHGTEGVNRA